MHEGTVLTVENLNVTYPKAFRKPPFTAVDGVSLSLAAGRTLGLVGESGSGKSTIGRAILGLAPITEGEVKFLDSRLDRLSLKQKRRVAADLQVVFQDPYGSLNPKMTIAQILTEPLRVHRRLSPAEADRVVRQLLDSVGLPADSADRHSRDFSGGQRQRIAIARALAVEPSVIICDEPTSALDLSTQAQVLNLLLDLQRDRGLSYLFISHDLAVIRHMADEIAVMFRGSIVEAGTAQEIVSNPRTTYARRLLAASPVPDPVLQRQRRAELARLRDESLLADTPAS
jgi:peptide/nickel transport system ATP-binding protein